MTKTKTFRICMSVGVVAFCMVSMGVNAKGDESNVAIPAYAITKTKVTKTSPDAALDIMAYDLNRDGVLEMDEIGEKLFYQFDTDGNEILDNTEFDRPAVITLTPMEVTTITTTDYTGNGEADAQVVEVDTFMETSGLVLFDEDDNGLSAHEFIDKSLLQLDINKDGVVELDEWKNAYRDSRAPLAANNKIYN